MNTFTIIRGVFLLFLAGMASVAPAMADWGEGEALPDLASFDLQGELPALEGKVTYVDFWASWCPPCKAAFPAIEELYQKHGKDGFQVVAVSLDSNPAAMERFLKQAKPSFATVWDEEQALAAHAGIEVMPTSFVVDAEGTIRSVHRGWGGAPAVKALDAEIQALLQEAKQ